MPKIAGSFEELAPSAVCIEVDRHPNKYVGLSKRDLKDVQLRLLSEISNYRLDCKRARQRLESSRSALAEVRHEMQLLQAAIALEAVVVFPAPAIEVEAVAPEVVKVDSKTKKVG